MPDFVIAAGDTRPILTDTLTYSDGSSPNLAGATVMFVMRSQTSTGPHTNAAAIITNTTNPATVSYTFTAGDTATAGQYQASWKITFADASTMTWPTDGYLEITIEESLATNTTAPELVGLGQVKDHLNIPANNRTQDFELLLLMDAITPVIEAITGPMVPRLFQSQKYDGTGKYFIHPRHRPLIAVHQVVEYRGPIAYNLTQVPSPDLGTIYSYMFESDRITRRTVGGGTTTFPPGPESVFITYTAGRATIPANVVMAALELIRLNWQQTQLGRPMMGGGGAGGNEDVPTGPMTGFFVPGRVRELLQPSRRHPSIA